MKLVILVIIAIQHTVTPATQQRNVTRSIIRKLMHNAIYALVVESDASKGIAYLRRVLKHRSDIPYPYEWLGYALCLRGEYDMALRYYRAAARLRGGAPRVNAAWFAPRTTEAIMQLANIPRVRLAMNMPADTQLLRSVFFTTAPCYPPLIDWRDPRYHERYNQMLYVYRTDVQRANIWRAVGRIHFRTATLSPSYTNWLTDALHAGRALAITTLISWSKMDYLPVERTPINLWLAEEGEPTAITVTGHTYWHGISPNRTFAQWFIDVSHEYGHHAFPAFGPFTGNHERYAGGYLSERLNAIWLLEALRSNRAWLPERMTAKAQAELQAYIRQYHLQDVREWCEWLYRQTKAGAMATVNVSEATQIPMSVFLGSAIFIERCFGDSFLKSVLDGCTDQTYDAFIGSFQKHIQRALDEGEVHIDPRITFAVNARTTIAPLGDLIASTHSFTLPSTQLLPMWLPKYTIKCEVSLKLPKGAKVIMHVNGKGVRTNLLPSERQGGCARVIALLDSKIAGWHFIKLQIMGRGEATIERMVLRKVEEVTER